MNQETKYSLFLIITFGVGSIIAQSVFVPFLQVNVWQPDVVLVIVLLLSRRLGSISGSSSGFFLGVVQDSLTGMPLGISAMPKAIAGYAAGKSRQLGLEGAAGFIWSVILILMHEMIVWAFFRYKSQTPYLYLLYSRVFPNTIYTTAMLVAVSLFTHKYFDEK
jgi:rod shape-determining protein MreD